MTKKIAFYTEQIDVRGTCTAVFDYAHYNEVLLNNKSIIVYPKEGLKRSDDIAILKFMNRFEILSFNDLEDLERLIDDCDILYCIKFGKNDGFKSNKIKTVIHCVFDLSEPHGNVYAGVSESLANKFNTTIFVPHMIGLIPSKTKENFKERLSIPENAVVFGRHGGLDTFDLEIARNAIRRTVRDFSNIYFIFVNTPRFHDHHQIIFLDKIIDDSEKNFFISTCDAGLECGSLGHSFGLSLGEFSVNNKPCICYNGWVWNRSHLDILKDKGIYFQTEDELYNILTTFDPKNYIDKDNNCYKDYSPEKVMQIFKKVFIENNF